MSNAQQNATSSAADTLTAATAGLNLKTDSPHAVTEPALLSTAHGLFIEPSPIPGHPPIARLLRGVNLSSSSKYPTFPPPAHDISPQRGDTREERDASRARAAGFRTDQPAQEAGGIWDEAESGGRDGWFVNRPLHEDWADLHFTRLKAWGFTMIRWIVPWEALEHAGPGKYDEAFIDYTIRLLRKAKAHNFRVFISPHQDVFSRFTGGSGAPYWALHAVGINPRRVHQTGSAVVHSQWTTEGWGGEEGREAVKNGDLDEFPDMIWNTNTGRLAARHCFTMFFASEAYAPKCLIDGEPVGAWLRQRYNNAYAHLAERFEAAGGLLDSCVIGWDSMNEPDGGFVGIPDLNDFPPSQEFRKGPSPTPIQAFNLAAGRQVHSVQNADFGSLGLRKKGKLTITPPEGDPLWLTRSEAQEAASKWGWTWASEWSFWDADGGNGCPWAGHGVWDPATGDVAKADYFKTFEGRDVDFIADFWKPHYAEMIKGIRRHHPKAISFINPPIFEEPPQLSQVLTGGRMALSAHYYDGLTMLGKRRHLFNADAVGIQRGNVKLLRGLKLGNNSIRENMRKQLAELASDASKEDGMAGKEDEGDYPMIVGELGTPWDMKHENKFLGLAKGKAHVESYAEPAKAMDQLLNACDGRNALSYTMWAYEPLNSREHGDGWNGEDLSLFSFCDTSGDDDLLALAPPDLRTLITLGARGIESWCRPYPHSFHGRVERFDFSMKTAEFWLELYVPPQKDDPLVRVQPRLEKEGSSPSISTPSPSPSKGDDPSTAQLACTTIYLPYVHYAPDKAVDAVAVPSATDGPGEGTRRLLGEPDAEGLEWIRGQGAGRVDVELLEMSEGRMDLRGQWARWVYPLLPDKGRVVRLGLKPWKG